MNPAADIWDGIEERPSGKLHPTEAELAAGVAWMRCRGCDGLGFIRASAVHGVDRGPEGQCPECKGRGSEPVTLW